MRIRLNGVAWDGNVILLLAHTVPAHLIANLFQDKEFAIIIILILDSYCKYRRYLVRDISIFSV